MAIKRFKDESNVIIKAKVKAGKKHYFHAFLWEDKESFDANTYDGSGHGVVGLCNLAPTIILYNGKTEKKIIRPKLGEVHFIKGKWDLEIVAHELCHALIQRLRMILPNAEQVVEQECDYEEDICYEFGAWVDEIYRLLYENDNPKNWITVEADKVMDTPQTNNAGNAKGK